MLKYQSLTIFPLLGILISACSNAPADVQETAQPASSVIENPAPVTEPIRHNHDHAYGDQQRTVKPGADLNFSHSLQNEPALDQYNLAKLTISHRYKSGKLELTVTSDDALVIDSASQSKTLYITEPGDIDWDISFKPTVEGVAYIKILGRISDENGYSHARAYAIRVETGNISTQAKSEANITTNADGERIIISPIEAVID